MKDHDDLRQKAQILREVADSLLRSVEEQDPAPPEPTEPPPPVEPNDEVVTVTLHIFKNAPSELSITAHPVRDKTPLGLFWRKDSSTNAEELSELKSSLETLVRAFLEK